MFYEYKSLNNEKNKIKNYKNKYIIINNNFFLNIIKIYFGYNKNNKIYENNIVYICIY